MTRKRISLTLVPNESARKTTFKKRKVGLTKKMEEITTLCGINGCLVVFNPKEAEPYVWPSKETAMELFARYESMPKTDQDNKKVDHEKFMTDRVERLREHVAKREKKNKEIQASLIMHDMSQGKKIEELNITEVELLVWFSEMKLKAIQRQNILLPPIKSPPPPSSTMPPPPPAGPPPPPPPPPFVVEPLPMVDHGIFMAGNAQNGGDFQLEPSFQSDPFFMNMFMYGNRDAGPSRIWPGESSNANEDFDFLSGFEPGSSSSFPGFP